MQQTFKDLYQYMRKYPAPYILGLSMLLFSSFFTTLSPLIIGRAIDAFNAGTMTMSRIWLYAGGLLAVMAVAALATITVRRTLLNASWEIQFDIRRDLFEHFTKLDAEFYDNNRVGDVMTRLTADLNAVRMFVGVAVFQGTSVTLMLIFTLWRMFQLNVTLSLLTLLAVPIITLTFFFLLRMAHKRYLSVQEQFSNVSSMAQENFNGIRVVKGFGIEQREIDTFETLNAEFIKRNLSLTKVDGPLFPAMELLFGATLSLLLLIGGRIVLGVGSSLSIGEFSSFVFLFEGIQWPLIGLGWIANIVQRGVTSWGRLKEILDTEPVVKNGSEVDTTLSSIKGDIEFKEVSLKFADFTALDKVSFHIRAGENIGITGRTGSGKTMLVNLITRVLEPSSGQILIDGHDIKTFPIEVLRRYIGIVPQEPFLFSTTIAGNIAYGIPKGDNQDKIIEVSKLVQLHGDIADFPAGYETSLGERGVTLSGGQRQRTAMARAIIRDPAILILDDSLSAVDTQTEARILEGLDRVMNNRTSLIIAHRVSAFESCERIYVLTDGRITESGSHEELIAKDGWYADMNARQQLEADLESAV